MTTIDTPVPVPVVPFPAPSAEARHESGRIWFKEIITALLALVVLFAMLVAYDRLSKVPDFTRYGEGQEAAREANASQIDKIANALFGIFAAFVGYYAGRVPAEKAAADSRAAADQAQQLARASQSQSANAQAELNEQAKKLDQALVWSERATDLLTQSVVLLDSERGKDLASSPSDDISPRLFAAEVARHLRRRPA